jgi:hypothetical protein
VKKMAIYRIELDKERARYDNFIVYKIRIMYTYDRSMKFSLCDVLV